MTDRLTWTNEKRRLGDLAPWERNPRQIRKAEAERLADSWRRFGQPEVIAIGPGNEVYNGHQRLAVWAAEFGDVEVDVRVASRSLTERERQQLTVYLHAGATGGWSWDDLAGWDMGDLSEWGFDGELLKAWNDDAANLALMIEADAGLQEDTEDDADEDVVGDPPEAPDAAWATDNEFDIPLLDINLQAPMLVLPLSIWGATSRKRRMAGTWAFYTEDYRYTRLWKEPGEVLATYCAAAVEPNLSCYSQMPRVVGLWRIYQKRWIARYWQSFGLPVIVDLNVAERFQDDNLLGVPKGWKSYATRGYTERIDATEREYEIACSHAGTSSVLFVVYGGGRAVEARCKERGWLWFPEEMQRMRREEQNGQE